MLTDPVLVCAQCRRPLQDGSCNHDDGVSSADPLLQSKWQTPHGNGAWMVYRNGTSDWNTISACLQNPYDPTSGDEYHLPSGLSGWALDLGGHVGSVTVGLLLDNPALRVLVIEPVPPNVEVIEKNLELNGLEDRAVVWHAAGWSKRGTIEVEYDYQGSETAEVHRFIGSISPWISDAARTKVPVKSVTLADALKVTDGAGFAWVKTDCEGGEHHFFRGAGMKKVGTIEGEWHRRDGDPEGFVNQLSATHVVQWDEGIGGGPFKAVPRG